MIAFAFELVGLAIERRHYKALVEGCNHRLVRICRARLNEEDPAAFADANSGGAIERPGNLFLRDDRLAFDSKDIQFIEFARVTGSVMDGMAAILAFVPGIRDGPRLAADEEQEGNRGEKKRCFHA